MITDRSRHDPDVRAAIYAWLHGDTPPPTDQEIADFAAFLAEESLVPDRAALTAMHAARSRIAWHEMMVMPTVGEHLFSKPPALPMMIAFCTQYALIVHEREQARGELGVRTVSRRGRGGFHVN